MTTQLQTSQSVNGLEHGNGDGREHGTGNGREHGTGNGREHGTGDVRETLHEQPHETAMPFSAEQERMNDADRIMAIAETNTDTDSMIHEVVNNADSLFTWDYTNCLLYTSPSPRD